jgi:hypothetical protein
MNLRKPSRIAYRPGSARFRHHQTRCRRLILPSQDLKPPAAGSSSGTSRKPLLLPALHPLEAVHELVKSEGIANIFRETTVPALPTGTFTVDVMANLYTERPNVVSLGVKLRVPPHPPVRAQAVTASAQLKPPADNATILLRLSPLEKLEYTYSTFAVVSSTNGIEQREGPQVQHSGERLDLSFDDFPIRFIPIEAAAGLLEIAVIHGICRWTSAGIPSEQRFDLSMERPMFALAVPSDAEGATLEIEATDRGNNKSLNLGPLAATSLRLDLFSFCEYGPHKVDIECVFGDVQSTYILELLPDGKPETGDEVKVLGFTHDQPKKEWTWFAESPFSAGYRYRRRRGAGEPAGRWSELQSPFEPLKISAAAPATGGAA